MFSKLKLKINMVVPQIDVQLYQCMVGEIHLPHSNTMWHCFCDQHDQSVFTLALNPSFGCDLEHLFYYIKGTYNIPHCYYQVHGH